MNIAQILNDSPYQFYFLVIDKFLDIQPPDLTRFQTITSPKYKNSGQLLSSPATINLINQQSANYQTAVIPFKPSAKTNLVCQKHHWVYVGNSTAISRILEDKIKFYQLCQTNHLPLVPSNITTLTPKTFKPNYIIQTRFGWAGKCTFSFSNYQEAIRKIPTNTPIKISPFIDGYTLTNNSCLTRFGLIQSPPALQYTGLKPYTTNPFATVGRQWPCLSPPNIQEQIKNITQKFSDGVLKPLKYRGFFGLDFLVNHNNVYLLECNPRLTASFAFYTKLEITAGLNPLFYLHLAEFTNLDYHLDINQEQHRFYLPITGSELTPKDPNGRITDQIHYSYPLVKSP